MFFFVAAKHASHALPVKDLTRPLPAQIEGLPGKNAVPPSVRESWKYRQLASHGEERAVQFSVSKNDYPQSPKFHCNSTLRVCWSTYTKIAPSTKPIHLGRNRKNKDNIKNDTNRILAHAVFFIPCHRWDARLNRDRHGQEARKRHGTPLGRGLALYHFPRT